MLFDKAVKINSFQWEKLPQAEERQLDKAAQVCKGLAVAMVARANSGHPRGRSPA